MPLAAIGVAAQGLDAPLSILMAAVQGLLARDGQPPDPFAVGGILGAVRVRRRVRRWRSLSSVPLPWDLLHEKRRTNHALLFSLGVM